MQRRSELVQVTANRGSKLQAELTEGLYAIADELGGLNFGRSNDIGDLAARLVATEQGHYILAYAPPAGTFVDRGKARLMPVTVFLTR